MKRWWVAAVYALFFLAMNWPVLPLVNRVEPRVGSVPFLVAWFLFWSLAIAFFHAALLFSVTHDPRPSSDSEDREVAS